MQLIGSRPRFRHQIIGPTLGPSRHLRLRPRESSFSWRVEYAGGLLNYRAGFAAGVPTASS
jgi:hypothetical protein